MGRVFSFVVLLAVVGTGAYVFMRQTQAVTGDGSPASVADVVAVKRDLMNIARAERTYQVSHSSYGSISDLRAAGELSIGQESRGPYSYSVDVSGSGFRVIATYSGPENTGAPRSISVDETMHFSQE